MLAVRLSLGGLLCVAALSCGTRDENAGDGVGLPAVDFGPWTVRADSATLPRGRSGAWDDGLIDPGAMIYHQGLFHSFYNAIRTWPSPLAIGYAASEDGLIWQRRAGGPVFDGAGIAGSPWTIRANSVLAESDRWVLFYSAGPDRGMLHGWIGRASAPSPLGPWAAVGSAVLEPGAGGSWTAGAVGDAKVVPVAEGYVMFFTGIDGSGRRRIGRAVSADLEVWTALERPILEPGRSAAWDAEEVSDPSVARTPDGAWVMVYRGRGERGTGLGWARSDDGVTWEKAGEPFVRSWTRAEWSTIFFSALVPLQQRHYVYFEAADSPGGETQVYAAWRELSVER